MESKSGLIIPLKSAANLSVEIIGSKAKSLSILKKAGFKIPDGFCISSDAYSEFIRINKLDKIIEFEINKKPMEEMRWEEIWDVALRIKSAFLKSKIPATLEKEIFSYLNNFPQNTNFSVRSSSTKEDSSVYSFAGIHESFVNIQNNKDIIDKIKLVWASLWSNRAILYRKELSLDPKESKMAVVIQEMVIEKISGLAFSINPNSNEDKVIIEAIDGSCSELVDNIKEPQADLLSYEAFKQIETKVKEIEKLFNYPVDVEWTGIGEDFTVLQTRPITTAKKDTDKERQWYLSLTPSFASLKILADKVENNLIPELENEGGKLSTEFFENLDKERLAEKIKQRAEIYFKWKKIYWDEFIPLAHGIRSFGDYYNNLIKPEDPFEFIELLKTDDMLATKRNDKLSILAEKIKNSIHLKNKLESLIKNKFESNELIKKIINIDEDFSNDFISLLNDYFNISYSNKNINSYPEIILKNLIELSEKTISINPDKSDQKELVYKFFQKAENKNEAEEYLRIGKLSWKLRDDDNILLSRLENALLKLLDKGADVLIKENIIQSKDFINSEKWALIYEGLLGKSISLKEEPNTKKIEKYVKHRQLIGQPASNGYVEGKAVVINDLSDFPKVKKEDILVCDSIQPQMTFLIPLVSGIIERRGGMLVHSSIIARELGIPAVNGVSRATEYIKTGDFLTINGYLGIVTIGEPELETEKIFKGS